MPACVPVNNNNVGDINGSAKPPGQSDSKLSKIISCLFLRKKTDVVDMTKESSAAAKKQKLSVDRSERSRRVLKMESMRTAPTSRDETDTPARVSQGQNQMFLPSENPTASFLSYLNPTVRRACSEVIRTNNTPSNNKLSREAFTESRRKIHTRNTNYRGQQASGTLKKGDKSLHSKPPKPPDRQSSVNKGRREPIVVPGLTSQSDDDNGYDSDNEISDLQDEMRRMNLSQPDLRSRTTNGKTRRREGGSHGGSLSEEGSISLSEGSDVDEIESEEGDRPQNPSPGNTKPLVTKQQSMEEVIDDLFQQTQQNIDTIYKNGIESLDLETYRSDTMTPDTYMKRLEEDLLKSQVDEQSSEEQVQKKPAVKEKESTETENKQTQLHNYEKNDMNNPHMENLLSEVSLWAQDRQRWLLEDGDHVGKNGESSTRESTAASMTTDGRFIEHVAQTNKNKYDWTTEKSIPPTQSKVSIDPKANGILTGPKLFRSTSKNPISKSTSFGENSKSSSEKGAKSNSPNTGLQIIDLGKETEDLSELPDSDVNGPYPEPWTSDMYTSTPRGDPQDRSTINDDLSELDEQYHFRARSPDSWLSSNVSCSNVLNKTSDNTTDVNEGFEVPPTPTKQIETPVKITATNVAKSHQIVRMTPKVHTPFRTLERQVTPMPTEPPTIPTKPMLRNTQLKPLTVLRAAKPRSMIDNFPVLPGYKVNNKLDETSFAANQARPFSEIPLRTDVGGNDRNSSLLVHSSSAKETREQYEQGVTQGALRPVSETIPAKRIDKIGVGPIMATKEKQMYARDIMNAMEKHRLQPQQGAFQEKTTAVASPNEPLIEYDDEKENETGRKRHKVFTNSLMTGGYSYDKHSRRKPSAKQPELKPPESSENVNFSASLGQKSNPATTSVNDLSFSISDNSSNPKTPRYSQDRFAHSHLTMNGHFQENQTSQNRAYTSQSFNIGNTQGTDKKRGNKSQSFQNKYTAVQSHGLGVPPTHGLGLNSETDVTHSQTANKFRKLRSRRDQEMEWLMKDAAETEV